MAVLTRVRTSDALAAFLHDLEGLAEDRMIDNVPGLGGVWRAGQIRQGLKQHAICVHHDGEHLAATSGPSFNNWQRDIAYWLESGPVSPRRLPEVAKTLAPPKPTVVPLKDGDRVVSTPNADPWAF